MMPTETIIYTLLSAAAFLKQAVQDVASQSVRDAYAAAKTYLQKKLSVQPDAAQALELATAKPESLMRKAVLAEECDGLELDRDVELKRLISDLAALVPALAESPRQTVQVDGDRNSVQVAGRDLIHTAKVIHRNTITPDERHVTIEQRESLRKVMRELAERLAGRRGEPNFGAVHRMMQRRFQVASYLLIPSGRFAEVMRFLRQQRALHRGVLRACNLAAFQADLYRAIFAGARELGWDGERVYRFADKKLELEEPLASLKELGPVQLKRLADFMEREVRAQRTKATPPDAPIAK